MGTLIAMARGISGLEDLADHTYVKCGTGKKAWGCWGGKSGGRVIGRGSGSSRRADKIAAPNERGGITCYLVNGVCHQAANRILIPTGGVLVTRARGYAISSALYGPFGRLGIWPCRAPFHQYKRVTGDLPACKEGVAFAASRSERALTPEEKLDWLYAQEALALYAGAPSADEISLAASGVQDFQIRVFMHMARFHMGPMLDSRLERRLTSLRAKVEGRFVAAVGELAPKGRKGKDYHALGDAVDRIAVELQDRLAHALTPEQYETLLGVERGEYVLLADPRIVKKLAAGQRPNAKRGKVDRGLGMNG